MHVIIDRHLITGQNDTSTLSAVQNLILLCNARLDSKFEISFLHIEEPGNSPQTEASFLFFPWPREDGGLCIGNYFIWCAKAHPLYHHVINFNSQRQHFSFVSSCVQRCWGGGEGGRDLLNVNSPTGLASIFRQIVRDEWVNDY